MHNKQFIKFLQLRNSLVVRKLNECIIGWLETFDSYTKDTNRILDNMLIFLKTHPKMRFMWCEVVFFERWWRHLNDTQKADVRQ